MYQSSLNKKHLLSHLSHRSETVEIADFSENRLGTFANRLANAWQSRYLPVF